MVTASKLFKAAIDGADGHIGSVHDVYFDDQSWMVRYLVVDTGRWLPGRKVLLSPEVIVPPWHGETAMSVKLARDQVRSSPEIDKMQRIPRQAEQLLHRSPNPEVLDMPTPSPPPPQSAASREERHEGHTLPESPSDFHLGSAKGVRGYRVWASDADTGHVADILFDDELRRILFFVVDIEEWLSGKKVLVSPRFVPRVDLVNSRIEVEVLSGAIKTGQAYEPAA